MSFKILRKSLFLNSNIDIWRFRHKRYNASISGEAKYQSELFELESKRQKSSIGRIEKIEVICKLPREEVTLMMNKELSTPHDCAKHVGNFVCDRAALALINGETLWHLHKPLQQSCTIEFLDYKMQQPTSVNKAYWRTCSFLLGAVISNAFKDKIRVNLHSFPSPNVRSGSFLYDAQLSLEDWSPTENELRVLSIEMIKFCQENHEIQCLDVTREFALKVFKSNVHKTIQIPSIAASNNEVITLFKVGHHIDISKGPMISNTDHIGRMTVTNVIKINPNINEGGPLYRFQGVSLPKSIVLNHFAYGLIENRAKKLNPARIPGLNDTSEQAINFI